MKDFDSLDSVCLALTTFFSEIRMQSAALRAYDNIFQGKPCENVFIRRACESIWYGLLSELARVFDRPETGPHKNCTLSRLKALCLEKQYSHLFPNAEKDELIQALDDVLETYRQLPIKRARDKQLSHHDMHQLFSGKPIEISLEQIEHLIADTTVIFSKIYTQYYSGIFEFSFTDYNAIVKYYEDAIKQLMPT